MKKNLTRNYLAHDDRSNFPFGEADRLLLKNGTTLDFVNKQKIQNDILIDKGMIVELGQIQSNFDGKVIDLTDKLIVPGMLDLHAHFREPGREDEETLMSGALAAMTGGFTGVCTMPNTQPATDNRETVQYIFDKFRGHLVDVYPIAAITMHREGKQLVEMAELVDAGVIAFSDDGSSVANSLLLRRALDYSRMFNVVIIEHCEDPLLAEGGVMHEGFVSTKLGLPGIPSIAEEIIVARNIMLAKYTSGKMHIAHVSTAAAVDLIRRAKAEGVKVTCEVTPHHFTLTDEAVSDYDTNTKMNPPLRTQKDVEAIIAGLKDGTIDAIATDHAPHSIEEKEIEFSEAPFGIVGLETALGLAITQLVHKNSVSIYDVLEKMSVNPYKVLGLPVPQISVGEKANLSIIDPSLNWKVDKNKFKSKSINTPFDGWELTGKPFAVCNNNFFMIIAE
jgi:dihydroorotase